MSSPSSIFRSALFLDRDGVINIEKGYVHAIEDFEFVEGIFKLCRTANEKGMPVVVVTNQAGIGRGLYSEAQFQTLNDWMLKRFKQEGAMIEAIYHCPYHPEHGLGQYSKDSFDRKPNPGMILRARDDLKLDLSSSILIGDKNSDIAAAKAAGVGLAVFLGSQNECHISDKVISTLHEACELLLYEPPRL